MKPKSVLFYSAAIILAAGTAQADSYTFKINNTTDNKIVKLLVSEDGKEWEPFDVGSGIKPGETATMEWAESTESQNCKQKVKAAFDDHTESEVASFDFCEDDLELEF